LLGIVLAAPKDVGEELLGDGGIEGQATILCIALRPQERF
jgi:hypothetical protein